MSDEKHVQVRLQVTGRFGAMTRTERKWALQLEASKRRWESPELQGMKEALHPDELRGHVVKWEFESMSFRLAPKLSYLVDFYVLYADGHVELHEVKQEMKGGKLKRSSHWKTSIAKLKISAEQFPEFEWYVCIRGLDGSWTKTRSTDLFKRGKK